VAREGLAADPTILPPHAVRPYLDFARLSANALRAIARTVDRDEGFRARVAAAVDEAAVGRAGWLWLTRPEGWEEEVVGIEAERGAQAAEDRERRDERTATKRLAAAQAAAEQRAAEVELLRRELAQERELRTEAAARLADAESEVARLVAARTEVVRNLKDVEARFVERSTELNVLKGRLRRLEEASRSAGEPPPAGTSPAGPPERTARGVPGAPVPTATANPAPASPAGPAMPAGPTGAAAPGAPPTVEGTAPGAPAARVTGGRDRGADSEGPEGWPASAAGDELIRQIGRAAGGAADLADALAGVMTVLEATAGRWPVAPLTKDAGGDPPWWRAPSSDQQSPGGAAVVDPAATGPGTEEAGSGGATEPGGADDARRGTPSDPSCGPETAGVGTGAGTDAAADRWTSARRMPVRLPGGLFDDSVEAAEHLLRTPGAVLLVDGYNVSMTAWPDLPVAAQRRRLVTSLGELALRTSTPAEVVFDGADVDAVPVPAPARSLLRVRFSPPDVEADDVVLDLVAQLPVARPVIVVSSDNRIRDGARRLGANLVHARQLAELLARR
jgi:predicted RNA-binding protein with PIN domain